jgi:hypothetical protein
MMLAQDAVKDVEILAKRKKLDAIQDAIAEKRLADRVLPAADAFHPNRRASTSEVIGSLPATAGSIKSSLGSICSVRP